MYNYRIDVNTNDLTNYFNEMQELLENIPANFIFSIDEVGCYSWADKH